MRETAVVAWDPARDLATGLAPEAGRLLVAAASLTEPSFRRSVVLLLDHDEQGTLGVVLNQPTGVDAGEVLPAWRPHLTGPPLVFRGGPVALDSALAVAAVPGPADGEEPEGFRRVAGPLGVIDLDAPPTRLAPQLSAVRLFVGYAGWSAGQLEGELAQHAWYVVEGLPGDAFADLGGDPDAMWRAVLARQGGELAWLARYPEDPSLN